MHSFFRFGFAVVGLLVAPLWVHAARAGSDPAHVKATARPHTGYARSDWAEGSIGALNTNVFDLALAAASCAVHSGAVNDPATLTVIDYSLPSTAKRLWVYDLRAHELLYEELVAHGQGSGNDVPTMFSNEDDTHRSSLGLFATDDTYVGKNGYSLRLNGLEPGFNDRARDRAIVMHGAPYVSDSFVRSQGRLGRSWGCPALREGIIREVIDHVKGGGLLFVYYPDQKWLNASKFLGSCAAAPTRSSQH